MFDIDTCTYCGEYANSRDHVVPQSYKPGQTFSKSYVIPCCKHCNSMLGNVAIHNIAGRADFVSIRLRQKYNKLIKGKKWKEEEINDLVGKLKRHVRSEQKRKEIVLRRIKWADHVAELQGLSIRLLWDIISGDRPIQDIKDTD